MSTEGPGEFVGWYRSRGGASGVTSGGASGGLLSPLQRLQELGLSILATGGEDQDECPMAMAQATG